MENVKHKTYNVKRITYDLRLITSGELHGRNIAEVTAERKDRLRLR